MSKMTDLDPTWPWQWPKLWPGLWPWPWRIKNDRLWSRSVSLLLL